MERDIRVVRLSAYVSVVLTGAIFGFFYAWVCSTMWGLDDADPRVAMAAMQQMNASVRNAAFFPAFFLTPVALAVTGALARRAGLRRAAPLFLTAGAVYLLGGLVLTMTVNVPLNEALARTAVPDSIEHARQLWDDYSGRWQTWNLVRTVLSGVSLVLAGVGLAALSRDRAARIVPDGPRQPVRDRRPAELRAAR